MFCSHRVCVKGIGKRRMDFGSARLLDNWLLFFIAFCWAIWRMSFHFRDVFLILMPSCRCLSLTHPSSSLISTPPAPSDTRKDSQINFWSDANWISSAKNGMCWDYIGGCFFVFLWVHCSNIKRKKLTKALKTIRSVGKLPDGIVLKVGSGMWTLKISGERVFLFIWCS